MAIVATWLASFHQPPSAMSEHGDGVCSADAPSVLISCYFNHFSLEAEASSAAGSTESQGAVSTGVITES